MTTNTPPLTTGRKSLTPAVVLDNIRAEMARRLVSREALAAGTGIPLRTLARRLTGATPLGIDELVRIAVHLRVHPTAFMAAPGAR